MSAFHQQKHISFDRHGDKIEVIIRNSAFVKTFQREVSINNKKDLEVLRLEKQRCRFDRIDNKKDKRRFWMV